MNESRANRRVVAFVLVSMLAMVVALGWPPPLAPSTYYGFVVRQISGTSGNGSESVTSRLVYDGGVSTTKTTIMGHEADNYLTLRASSGGQYGFSVLGYNDDAELGITIVPSWTDGFVDLEEFGLGYESGDFVVGSRSAGTGEDRAVVLRAGAWNDNIRLKDDNSVELGADLCFGDNATNGSWRIVTSGNNLIFQRREAGSWVTKDTITP